MLDSELQAEIVSAVDALPSEKQHQVLNYARSLQSSTARPVGTPGRELLKLVGRITDEDAELMLAAIEDYDSISRS